MKFKESMLAHKYCTGTGLEIGGSAHNPFGLKTKNVDFTKELTSFKKEEINLCGEYCPVDIEATGEDIPLPDESQDFIVSSHVLEHFTDPIKALLEWYRLIKKGGIIFMIVPHKERTFDRSRNRTTLQELIERHTGKIKLDDSTHEHYSVWITEDLTELINYMNGNKLFLHPVTIEAVEDVDDKVGNGFTIVLRKNHDELSEYSCTSAEEFARINKDQTFEVQDQKSVIKKQPSIAFIQANNKIDVQWYKPLVFGYLKAYLEKNLSFSVRMELVEQLKQIEDFQILAISSTSQNFASAISVARQAKQANKDVITVLGGHHVTYLHDTLTNDFDIGVIGEGEQTFLEIVNSIQAEGGLPSTEILSTIRGIVYWQNGKRVVTERRPLIEPLDSLPHPFRVTDDKPYIFTSRGCPFNCSFCSSSAFWHKTRLFSAEYVVEEIEQLMLRYPGIIHLPVQDDLFIANKGRLLKIIEMLEARKSTSQLSFSFSVRANLIDDDMCQKLTRLKIASVSFGAESGSDRILRLMNKNVTVAQNQNALNLLHQYKINAICSFIVGWPTETEEDVKLTFEFIKKNALENKLPTVNAINILMPIPGTSLWDESVKNGKIIPCQINWSQLSIFADYQHSRLNGFDDWVVKRRQNHSLYLAEDTLPQERLYQLMAEHYAVMSKIQEDRNSARMRSDESRNQLTILMKQLVEVERALVDQKTAINRWKALKASGQMADDSALVASAQFFKALLTLADRTSFSDQGYIGLQTTLFNLTSCYRDMEEIGRLIARCEDLEGVNKVIDERLLPKLDAWPSMIKNLLQDINHCASAVCA